MAAAAGSLLAFDRRRSAAGERVLAGVDEAGRGCWAGPVVAAAVVLPPDWCPAGLDDSKKMTAKSREVAFAEIRAGALSWGACAVSSRAIDSSNILKATLLAMSRAVARLRVNPELVLVDGLQLPDLPCPGEALVKGDGRSAAVAAASVVAKVLRDRVMISAARLFPGYGFAANKGYGAPVHREALRRLGPCAWHRFSYRPVAECDQARLWHDSR